MMYASPNLGQCHHLWEELCALKLSIIGLWKVVGNFNIVLFLQEKVGGRRLDYNVSSKMLQCLSSYELMDMGFFGPFLTLSKGSLKKHID